MLITSLTGALLLPTAATGPVPAAAAGTMGLFSQQKTDETTQGRVVQARIQHHIVIHAPRPDAVPRSTRTAPLPPIDWVEKRSNDCVSTRSLAGSAVIRRGSVDLDLNGGRRIRAQLGQECPALDFYAGFYVKPNKDGKVCANRDSFRLRSGGECRIRAFRTLIPGR